MGRYLPEMPTVADLHDEALDLAVKGYYPQARAIFSDALQALGELDPQNAATTVQRARIQRDDGFNTLRWALLGDNEDGLEDAARQLEGARLLTAPFVAGEYPPYVGEVRNFVSKHQRREMVSEHAATLGCQVRLEVARQIRHGDIVPDRAATDEVLGAQFMGGVAWDLAKIGTNQYYAASIAMNGARIEVINGRFANVWPWRFRAALSLDRALLRDSGNFGSTLRTVGRLTFDLSSRERAMRKAVDPRTV